MKHLPVFLILCALPCSAQLTTDQRMADFRNLADLYARRYDPIQWKLSLLNFDVLNLDPWMGRIASLTNDLDFYDLMVEYVSDLQDAHDQYSLPSDFEAYLGFTVDLYDGQVVIDSIDRDLLPPEQYPFQAGDQLVSLDGNAAGDLVKLLSKYVTGGNPRTVSRLAAGLITDRWQQAYPYAPQIGDSATVVVLRQSGDTETYSIPWQKTGTPLTGLGPSPGPHRKARPHDTAPYYQRFLNQLHSYTLPGRINVLGFNEVSPVFSLPDNFLQRLGTHLYDSYYSGTYQTVNGTRIGYLRIPDFLGASFTDLDNEMQYFEIHTDVLVVDVMRNPGGDACIAEQTLSRFAKSPFQGTAAEFRVDWTDILAVNESLANAQAFGADDDTIAQLQLYQSKFQDAFQNNAGRTEVLPICASTLTRSPAVTAYTKPVLVLVDELSASSADIFAAMAQDNQIAPLFGYRTMGAGGSPESDYAGVYTEGWTSVTRSLVVRPYPIVTPDYPTTQYIENVGVRPDMEVDYMTLDNLTHQGSGFVKAFTAAAVTLANGK